MGASGVDSRAASGIWVKAVKGPVMSIDSPADRPVVSLHGVLAEHYNSCKRECLVYDSELCEGL